MIRNIYFVAFILFLSACSGKWEKNGSYGRTFDAANHVCEEESALKFPIRNEVAQRTKYGSHVQNCDNKDECNGKNYKVTEVPLTESYVMDVNEKSRESSYLSCMKKEGWEKKFSLIF